MRKLAFLGRMPVFVHRTIAIIALVIFLSLPGSAHAQVAGMSSIIVDANTGEVLQEQGADTRRFPASITKVMTLYMLFEQMEAGKVSMDTEMEVSAHASRQAPSKLGLRPGETISVREAINALAIKSANDVAAVVAEHIGGNESNFARMMTRKAKALGMARTQFANASGLPNPEQLTTARDLAILGYSIQTRFPEYSRAFAKSGFTYNGRAMNNHNRLLGRVEGVDGIKTGYTNASGFNLLSSMRVDGRHLIGVVMGGRTSGARDNFMEQLLAENIDEGSNRKYALRQFAGRPLGNATFAANDADEPAKTPKPKAIATGKPIQLASTDVSAITLSAPSKIPPVMPQEKITPKPDTMKTKLDRADVKTAPEIITASTKGMEWQKGPDGKPMKAGAKIAVPSQKPAPTPYAVQIAAIPNKKDATAMLAKAKSKAPKQLAKATGYTEEVKQQKGDKVYRVRFSNLDKDAAETACAELKKSAMPCMITRL